MDRKYTINLLKDTFVVTDKKGSKYVLEVDGRCVFADWQRHALITEGLLRAYFSTYLSDTYRHTVINKTLCDSLKSTYLTIHLSNNMPDLSHTLLCYESYVNCQSLSYTDVLKCILIKAIYGQEFYADFTADSGGGVCLAFLVTKNKGITTAEIFLGDGAQSVHNERTLALLQYSQLDSMKTLTGKFNHFGRTESSVSIKITL